MQSLDEIMDIFRVVHVNINRRMDISKTELHQCILKMEKYCQVPVESLFLIISARASIRFCKKWICHFNFDMVLPYFVFRTQFLSLNHL
jgi:hypothetical protein